MRSSSVNLILALYCVLFSCETLAQETPAPSLAEEGGGAIQVVDDSVTSSTAGKVKIPPLPSIIGTPYPAPQVPSEKEIVTAVDEVLQPLKPGQPLKSEQPPKQQPPSPVKQVENVVGFTKRIYSSLGTKPIADLAVDLKSDFDALNSDKKLGETLHGLYEMRLDDLKRSVLHAKKMRDLLDILDA